MDGQSMRDEAIKEEKSQDDGRPGKPYCIKARRNEPGKGRRIYATAYSRKGAGVKSLLAATHPVARQKKAGHS
jgi:hypothetical protein